MVREPILSQYPILKQCGRFSEVFKWIEWKELSSRILTINYSSNALKQHIIIIQHHTSLAHPPSKPPTDVNPFNSCIILRSPRILIY